MSQEQWAIWKNWADRISHDSSVKALQFLDGLTGAYQAELEALNENFDNEKKKSREKYQRKVDSINHSKRNEAETIGSEYLVSSRLYDDEVNKYFALHNDLNELIILFGESDHELAVVFEAREQLRLASEKAKKELKGLRDARLKELEARSEIELKQAADSYGSSLDNLNKRSADRSKELNDKYVKLIEDILNDDDVKSYINQTGTYVPSAKEYRSPDEPYELICFGSLKREIASMTDLYPEVSQMITTEARRIIEPNTPGKIVVKMPYCQRLEDGISLFVSHSAEDRSKYQEHMKMMLLRLFMSIPAGKLEATMIDPIELGGTFSMFTRLGEDKARIIDTKIWSQEKDITTQINILRQKLETMTQHYANNRAMRLKKEPLRVLAVTDFPIGFTQAALRDLQAIVRKSAMYGVCILIWTNQEEVKKMMSSQQSVFNEVQSMLMGAHVKDRQLIMDTEDRPELVLEFDDMKEEQAHIQQIIDAIAMGIKDSKIEPEYFGNMFDDIEDPNSWFSQDSISELAIPIGIKGVDSVLNMTVGRLDGSTAHHALIAGQVGAGKSTLLHTIIMSTLLNYYPDEVQLYLVDFKEGVEFKAYTQYRFPSIKVVAVDSEREFGLNILREIRKEMKRRYAMFRREADREEISEYRQVTGEKLPKILLIFDEVQELFGSDEINQKPSGSVTEDEITQESTELLRQLLTLGRAAGIHLVLASQSFRLLPSHQLLFHEHAAIRIAIKGSDSSVHSVLGERNDGALQLREGPAGAAIYNDDSGTQSANQVFQIAYLDKESRNDYLRKLNAIYSNEVMKDRYKEETRILLSNAEDDHFNVFNELIRYKKITKFYEDASKYALIIGDGFELYRKFEFGLAPERESNLLVVGRTEKQAASIFYFTMMSLLYGELGNVKVAKDNQLIQLIDLSSEDDYHDSNTTNFEHLTSLFPKQIGRAKMSQMKDLINVSYETLMRRKEGKEGTTERLFLMVFGIDRAYRLATGNMYQEEGRDGKSSLSKLKDLFRDGPEYGVNTIVWTSSLAPANRLLVHPIEQDFAKRIVFASDGETFKHLVWEHDGSKLKPRTAVYLDVKGDNVRNTHFRPYEIPVRAWVEDYADAYRNFE